MSILSRWVLASTLSVSVLAAASPGRAFDAPTGVETSAPNVQSKARTAAILSKISRDWFKGEWAAYKKRFISTDGRVIDNANGGASHSEGQGYGLSLALAADDAEAFDTIWRWTETHLRRDADALFSWKWDPRNQKTADVNNASDGDILIAWALARAAKRFGRPDYETQARAIAKALAAETLVTHGGRTLLLPAVAGFGAAEQPVGPVVNLSYWIFAAFRDLAVLDPGNDWSRLRQSGLALLDASRFGPAGLPSDWIALGSSAPEPAGTFAAQFGYDAIRIPLYLAQDEGVPRETLARFADTISVDAKGEPSVVDITTGLIRQRMKGVGYRAVLALARCASHGEAMPPELMSTRDAFYYPETLRLLSISVVQERLPICL